MKITSSPFLALQFLLAWTLMWTTVEAVAAEPAMHTITLSVHAPQAHSVEIAGNFNQWRSEATPLLGPDKKGMWSVELRLPASLNRIEYFYWIDGVSRKIDARESVIDDGFGGQNNIFFLP